MVANKCFFYFSSEKATNDGKLFRVDRSTHTSYSLLWQCIFKDNEPSFQTRTILYGNLPKYPNNLHLDGSYLFRITHSLLLMHIYFHFFFNFWQMFGSICSLMPLNFTIMLSVDVAQSLSCIRFSVTSCTVAHLVPLPVRLSWQEYWRGLPLPSPLSCY